MDSDDMFAEIEEREEEIQLVVEVKTEEIVKQEMCECSPVAESDVTTFLKARYEQVLSKIKAMTSSDLQLFRRSETAMEIVYNLFILGKVVI